MKKLVLFSGGMDSTVLLTQAVRNVGPKNVLALSIVYGSLHNHAEGEAAIRIADFLGVTRLVTELPSHIFMGGASALMGESSMPNEEYHDPLRQTPSTTIVPFRNGVMIAVATAYAEAHGYDQVLMAAHANDAIGWAYPDCMPEFLRAMAQAVAAGTLDKVRLEFPYVVNSKADLVTIGARARAPLNMTWSCYRGGDVHCGNCPTCRERIKAFHDAGYMDPTKYLNKTEYTGKEGLIVFPYGERP